MQVAKRPPATSFLPSEEGGECGRSGAGNRDSGEVCAIPVLFRMEVPTICTVSCSVVLRGKQVPRSSGLGERKRCGRTIGVFLVKKTVLPPLHLQQPLSFARWTRDRDIV